MHRLPQTPVARRRRRRAAMVLATVIVLVAIVVLRGGGGKANRVRQASSSSPADPVRADLRPETTAAQGLAAPATYAPGVAPNHDRSNLYYYDGPNMLNPTVVGDLPRIYVPNTESNSVSVIDPATFKVIQTIPVGAQPQHVSPSWDLRTLWVANDKGNSLTAIDPKTGQVGPTVPVDDPYNLYFTPDGTRAVVMAEAYKRMDFRDAHTMALQHSVPVPCSGLNHMDFAPDGRTAVASCEFDGSLLKIDIEHESILEKIDVGGAPQDVKLSPDATVYYVADMKKDGVHVIDATQFKEIEFIKTGRGTHGLYPSRDATKLYISNRQEGSISVLDFATRTVIAKWVFNNGHGSPDMGGVSADGSLLWLTGRYDGDVYAISTETGKLVVPPIRVGRGPHGACVWPQPGRYSMGHTGVMR
jgi:YVTN family beta-propeller protein